MIDPYVWCKVAFFRLETSKEREKDMAEKIQLTVVVVEDDGGIRGMLQKYLPVIIKMAVGKEGVVVGVAENGRTGLGLIKEYKPDLVFLDWMMPELDGFGVLEAIAEETWREGIRIIFMSGTLNEAAEKKARELKAAAVIHKPFGPDVLKAAIRESFLHHSSPPPTEPPEDSQS